MSMTGMAQSTSQRGVTLFKESLGSWMAPIHTLTRSPWQTLNSIPGYLKGKGIGHSPASGTRHTALATCDLQAATLNLPVFACTRSFRLILHRAGGQWSDGEMRWQAGCVRPSRAGVREGRNASVSRVEYPVLGDRTLSRDRGGYRVLRARRRGYACSV